MGKIVHVNLKNLLAKKAYAKNCIWKTPKCCKQVFLVKTSANESEWLEMLGEVVRRMFKKRHIRDWSHSPKAPVTNLGTDEQTTGME